MVMDKASFHKAPAIRQGIEVAACQLLFLPPYSPDLNPVAKRTEGHLKHSELNLKPGYEKWSALYFPYSNWLTASFKTLTNYEISYSIDILVSVIKAPFTFLQVVVNGLLGSSH